MRTRKMRRVTAALQLGSPEGELLVRPGSHVPGSDPAGLADVLAGHAHPQ